MDNYYYTWCEMAISAALDTVPLAALCYRIQMRVFAEAVAIGDTQHAVLSSGHAVALMFACAPAFYLPEWVCDWLKPYLTDNGVVAVYMGINALFWASLLQRVLGRGLARVLSLLDAQVLCFGLWSGIWILP